MTVMHEEERERHKRAVARGVGVVHGAGGGKRKTQAG
eukprot:CAMPEP_0118971830 /NCGR_PEP_ID=MMETSP1173-20130426/8345_1 /TAXON_ID=1034831 /ORGANISM="Rhizochromulina marina cf, Strain CCMP1243" /LENGTH=36 /DNA_ID= /DNA_START= /DNA_END= /DNA_ORIENTATION=